MNTSTRVHTSESCSPARLCATSPPRWAHTWLRVVTILEATPHADGEFAEQVLCATWKTNTGQNVHIPDAIGAGVRLEAIEALRD